MMPQLNKQVAVITGAANGLGKALAYALHRQGYHLALLDIDAPGLAQLQADFSGSALRISIHAVDISKEEDVKQAGLEILMTHRQVNMLINNAAVSISQPFKQLSLSDYKRLFDVNFWGTVHCTKVFLPELLQYPGSRLVNVISGFALMGFPGKISYGASKSAVMGFTNTLYTELAGTNVKVCLVIPPPMHTGIVARGLHIDENKRAREDAFLAQNGMAVEQVAAAIVSKVQAGRYRIVIGAATWWMDLGCRLFPGLVHGMIGRNKKRVDFI
jgi:short-subunit dehydrogenase